MRRLQMTVLLLIVVALQGCESPTQPCVQKGQESVAALQRQKDDTEFEMQLRQQELDNMMESARGNRFGVSHEWLERKASLTETITQLKVKSHDLDLQIAAAKQN